LFCCCSCHTDPKIKAHIKKYLATTSNQHLHNSDIQQQQQQHYNLDHINYSNPSSPTAYYSPTDSPSRTPSSSIPISQQRIGHRVTTSDPAAPTCRPSRIPSKIPQQQPNALSAPQSPHHQGKQQKRQHLSSIPTPNGTNNPNIPLKPQSQQEEVPQSQPPPPTKARFEAYMMTGDLILNLSRTPQSSGLIQPHTKKIDSLRDSPKHTLSNYGEFEDVFFFIAVFVAHTNFLVL
jgi:PH and SEC7 domain-containing protein